MHPAVDHPTRGARDTFSVLARAARALYAERDRDRLMGWATTATRDLTGASAAALFLGGPDGTSEWAVDGPPDLSALVDPRSHTALRRAWQGDATVRCDDVPEAMETASIARCMPDLRSLAAVPVVRTDGTPCGVLLIGDYEPGAFDDDDVAAAEVMAAHLGVALDNHAQLKALDEARSVQRQVVEQLQEAVRPPMPSLPDTELGVSYRPADPGAPTGGDLYDWVLLPDGRLHIAVVDVMGKGVGATKDAVAVTHVLRLLVLDGCPLEDVVARADSIVTAQNPELVATLILAHYDPRSRELVLAGAGHPPALLVSNGVARELPAHGVPIGWPGAGTDELVRVTLERGDTVVLYTDGLIEATKDILAGLEDLARYGVETATYPAAQQARVLVERALTGAARRDDSLAVVLRCRPAPVATTIALGPFEHHLSPSPATVSLARNLLREWLVRVPVEDDAVHDLLLVATELCANAVEHARWDNGGVALRAEVDGPDIVLEVVDDGGGLSWPHVDVEPPDAEAEQGRGLWLVHTLADEVVPDFEGAHTTVRARLRNVSSARRPPVAPAPPPA
ncbi:MAG TPA: SpoIIE family protein phosphatase [Acidimicrobiales bacterium]|nr:SpoIIE family protein phosphatase [Acidimicrobiales bacterium]